jgi:hypothetical protein
MRIEFQILCRDEILPAVVFSTQVYNRPFALPPGVPG